MDKEIKQVSCDDCKFNFRGYADGYILKNFTRYSGNIKELPVIPNKDKFWTYQECKKNKGKLQHLNLCGDCKEFESNETQK